jgi:3'-5' exoribonuclease
MERPVEQGTHGGHSGLVFRDLAPGMAVAGHARIVQAEVAKARTGGLYHRLVLGDALGARQSALRFDTGQEPAPRAGAVVRIAGVLERFRDSVSLKLTACVEDPAVPEAAFLPRIPAERAATLGDLDALIARIADPALRSWVNRCFDDATRERFSRHPASVVHHGAALGGLLAHSLLVARLALALADGFPARIDRDVLTAAALLHDIGKLDEVVAEPGGGFTDRGTLIGYVALGALHASRIATTAPDLDPARVDLVLHAMLAAHGRREYGAPTLPATLEAMIVHLADLAEARLSAAVEAIERAPAADAWTPYLKTFETRFRVPAWDGDAGEAPRCLPSPD